MGNYASRGFMCRDAVEDERQVFWWGDYCKAEWRSEKSRELDKLGGLGRHPVTRGDSLTTKLQFLSDDIQRAEFEQQPSMLNLSELSVPQSSVQVDGVGFMLHTDRRAVERPVWGTIVHPSPPRAPPLDRSTPARRNSLRGPGSTSLPAVRHAYLMRQGEGRTLKASLSTAPKFDSANGNEGLGPDHPRVPEWRIRIHKARRNCILVVLTCIRLQRGMMKPNRLMRLDSFSFYIPIILSGEAARFVEEQFKYNCIKKEIIHLKDSMLLAARQSLSMPPRESGDVGGISLRGHLAPEQQANPWPKLFRPRRASDTNVVCHSSGPELLKINSLPMPSKSSYSSSNSAGEEHSSNSLPPVQENDPFTELSHQPQEGLVIGRRLVSGQHYSRGEEEDEESEDLDTHDSAHSNVGKLKKPKVALQEALECRREPSFTFPLLSPTSGPSMPKGPVSNPKAGFSSSPHMQLSSCSLPSASSTSISGHSPASSSGVPKARRLPSLVSPPDMGQCHVNTVGTQRSRGHSSPGDLTSPSPLNARSSAPATGRQSETGSRSRFGTVGSPMAASRVRFSSVDGISPQSSSTSSTSPPDSAKSPPDSAKSPQDSAKSLNYPSRPPPHPATPHKYRAKPSPGGILLTEAEKTARAREKWMSAVSTVTVGTHESAPPGVESRPQESERLRILTGYLETEVGRLQRSDLILNMHINRANGVWAEQRQWEVPRPMATMQQQHFFEGEVYAQYKASLLGRLRKGEVAVQILAAEESVTLPVGQVQDLWNIDPWELVAELGLVGPPPADRIKGLAMGARGLVQLQNLVASFGGPEAAREIKVILHLHNGQELQAMQDLNHYGLFGLKRENLYICIQKRPQGYKWDSGTRRFERDSSGPRLSQGSGFSCMQLNWVAEAFTLNEDGSYREVQGTMLEALAAANVEWLVSVQARDLASSKDAVDLPLLAYTMYLRDQTNASMSLQVFQAASFQLAREYDSLVLSMIPDGDTSAPPHQHHTNPGFRPVCDLCVSEVSSSRIQEIVGQMRQEAGGALTIGLRRYMFYLPSLAKSLAEMSTFRPKLVLDAELVYVKLEMSDLTSVNIHSIAHDRMCVAINTRADSRPTLLTSKAEVNRLVALIRSQDADVLFRHHASRSLSGSPPPLPIPVQQVTGQKIVIFVADNVVTPMAVDLVALMAQPGKDVVYLVTVVGTVTQQPAGQNLVSAYAQQLRKLMVETHMDIVVKGYGGLLDCLVSYTEASQASLVVMGSQCLNSGNLNSMGSVTLSCMKRLTVPMAIVTTASKNVQLVGGVHKPSFVKAMLVVENHARPLMTYVCSNCMDRRRGDQLLLAQANSPCHGRELVKGQVSGAQRHTMASFQNIASELKTNATQQLILDAQDFEKALQAATTNEGVHLVGIQLPPAGSSGPRGSMAFGPVVNIIRKSRAATLVFR